MSHPAWDAAADLRRLYQRANDRISELEEMAIGPTLFAELVAVAFVPMDACGAIRVRALWERVARFVDSMKMVSTKDAIDGAEHLPGLDVIERMQLVSQDIASIGQIHKVTAMREVALTAQVADDLPKCWTALNHGDLSLAHVRALADVVDNCPSWVAQAVDAQAVPLAIGRRWTPGRLAAEADKIVMTIDPDGAADRAAAAEQSNSDVRFRGERDELATVTATGDAIGMRDAMNVLDDRAEELRRAGDGRRIGELRIAAFKEAILGETPDVVTDTGEVKSAPEPADSSRSERRWRRRDALVRIDLSTYLGADDKPGWLDGYGPISARTARALVNDASMRRMLADPVTGATIDLGRSRYRPSQALRDAVVAGHLTCVTPGCDRPARNCQIDHRHERRDGGATDLDNLEPLCVFHHVLKTKRLMKIDHNADGSYTVRTPLGFRFTRPPEPYPIELVEPPDVDVAPDLPDDVLIGDPEPPRIDDPLPDMPPLTAEEFLDYCDDFARMIYEDPTATYAELLNAHTYSRS